MHQKVKYVWWFVLALWGLLPFSGIPLPTDHEAAVDWLTSIDLWFINTVAYPSLLAIWVGLVFGTVIIPEIWRRVHRHLDDPRPNMIVRDALNYAITDTKWRFNNPHSVLPLHAAKTELDQRAVSGEIQLWGQREIGGTRRRPEFSVKETPIPREYWDKFNINLNAIYEPGGPPEPQTEPENPNDLTAKNVLRYRRLRVDKRQIQRGDWERATLLQRTKKCLAASISVLKKPARAGR